MNISLNWLINYVDIPVDLSPDALAHKLTMLGLEIESITKVGQDICDVVTGRLLEIKPHPDADKLVVCKTDVGKAEPLQIVCGATNMKVGDIVPTAQVGATLPGGFEITRRKMRGIESQGMMCSAKELGLGDDHMGLLILDPKLPIGKDIRPLLGLDDVVFELEVTPNRNDWSGLIGIAREIAALFNTTVHMPDSSLTESGHPADSMSSVQIEDPDLCPRYIGRILTQVHIGPSPEWLVHRLVAAGQRPINNVVDVTNYVLMETGHPLHAFDYDKLQENRIVVRRARAGETTVTLDEEARKLEPDMLVIADAQEPVAIAGIMGGRDSEVSESTHTVFLESAWFEPTSIRKTARTLGMITEASQRFQRGADPNMARFAIDRAARLMAEVSGASIAPGVLDAYPRPFQPAEITLRYARTDEMLGVHINLDEQCNYLERLGFEGVSKEDKTARFRVPSWRHDCTLEADLIEEIARLHGYNNIEATLPLVRGTETHFAPEDDATRSLRMHLVGLGLSEAINMSFSCPEDVRRIGMPDEYLDMVFLYNPLSEKLQAMRTSLLPGLASTIALNTRRGTRDVALFEIGPVYSPSRAAALPDQHLRLAIAISGVFTSPHWSAPPVSTDIYDLKGILEDVLLYCAIEESQMAFDADSFGPMARGTCARISANGMPLGWMGMLNKHVCTSLDIEQEVFMAEIDLMPLVRKTREYAQFSPIPQYPPSLRDLAVVVDSETPAGALCDAVRKSGGKYLRSVQIFDVYTGKQVPSGKKSIAFNLVFQAMDKTLTEKVTEKACSGILTRLKSDFGAELR